MTYRTEPWLIQLKFVVTLFLFYAFATLFILLSNNAEYWEQMKKGALMNPWPDWFIVAVIVYAFTMMGMTIALFLAGKAGNELFILRKSKGSSLVEHPVKRTYEIVTDDEGKQVGIRLEGFKRESVPDTVFAKREGKSLRFNDLNPSELELLKNTFGEVLFEEIKTTKAGTCCLHIGLAWAIYSKWSNLSQTTRHKIARNIIRAILHKESAV
jgi:hypothetical protein